MTDSPEHADDGTDDKLDELSPGARQMLSRRGLLQTGAVAAAGASGLALGSPAAAQSIVDESCAAEFEEIELGDAGDWHLMNNTWGMPSADQCIYEYDDGSFGYDFDATHVDCDPNNDEAACINYPEVYCGTRPWGSSSGIQEIPQQRSEVDELILEWDVDIDIPNGEWDLAEEWWLIDGEPHGDQNTLWEIMLVLDWGGGHNHYMEERAVIEDQFGNTIDHWADYSEEGGGAGANFHIFRIDGGASSGRVDLTEIRDYVTEHLGARQDLTMTAIEVGNEYWVGAEGEVTYNTMALEVDGSRYAAGSDTDPGPEPPTSPDDVWTNEVAETTVDVSWSSVSNADEYDVYLDGSHETTTSSTSTSITGLSPDTQYTVGVESVNDAGSSDRQTTTVTTDQEEVSPCENATTTEVEGQTVCDLDGDGNYRDVNGDGDLGQDDVVGFFEVQHRSAWKRDEFDFSGNGEVNQFDVVELFDYTLTN